MQAASFSRFQLIIIFLSLSIMFGFTYLPPFDPITPIGMQILGIFIGVLLLWTCVGILWPSLLGLVAIGLSDYAPMRTVLSVAFGDIVAIMIFFAMVLFGAIQHYGVPQYISRWFLTRKIINGKPVLFSFIFIYTTYVLAALSANVLPPILFMWATLYSVLQDVGYKKGDAYSSIMVIGTLFGGISGQAAKPFMGSPMLIVSSFEKASLLQMDYLLYMTFGFIMSSLGILCYALVIKYVLKPDMSKIAAITTEQINKNPLPPMDTRQKVLFVTLFGYLLLVLLPNILPFNLKLIHILREMGPWGLEIAILILLSVFTIKGEPIINIREMLSKYVIWDVYLLICLSSVIAEALITPSTGIAAFLSQSLAVLFTDVSGVMLTIFILAFCMGLAQIANNVIMGVLMMPVLQHFYAQAHIPYAALATLLTFAMHIALLTPATSPYAAVLYGNTLWLDRNSVIKYTLVILSIVFLLFMFLGIPLAQFLF